MSTPKTRFATDAAKRLRANSTDAERRLWSRLRNRQLLGCKFVRQQAVGPYIADFACRERDLIIELDGGQHATRAGSFADAERTDILTNIDRVLQVIADRLQKAPSPGLRFAKSDLSPKGEMKEGPAHGR